jgi:hypothetical protein
MKPELINKLKVFKELDDQKQKVQELSDISQNPVRPKLNRENPSR